MAKIVSTVKTVKGVLYDGPRELIKNPDQLVKVMTVDISSGEADIVQITVDGVKKGLFTVSDNG